jgi:hypothetical protein
MACAAGASLPPPRPHNATGLVAAHLNHAGGETMCFAELRYTAGTRYNFRLRFIPYAAGGFLAALLNFQVLPFHRLAT